MSMGSDYEVEYVDSVAYQGTDIVHANSPIDAAQKRVSQDNIPESQLRDMLIRAYPVGDPLNDEQFNGTQFL